MVCCQSSIRDKCRHIVASLPLPHIERYDLIDACMMGTPKNNLTDSLAYITHSYLRTLLDDLGLEPLSNAQCNDLLEIIEDRYGQSSTIVVSQFPVDKWHGLMENPTTADAILDRLVHNAHRLVLQGESMRKNKPAVESDEKTG